MSHDDTGVAALPDMKVVVGRQDDVWFEHETLLLLDDERPRFFTHYVSKNRFPTSFPTKFSYDAGFGLTKEWLKKNVEEYSVVTFEEVTCNGTAWTTGSGRVVELQGPPVPGTMVLERGTHRTDLDSRTGIIMGSSALSTLGVLSVMWMPWRFLDDT